MPSECHHSKEWFVIRSKPRREDCAVRHLLSRGVEVFFPRILEPVGIGSSWATVPLFPGYLFVEIALDRDFHQVVWTPGVKGFVAFGEVPTAVQPAVVHFLRAEAAPDGVIRRTRRFRVGERVRIKRGPFAGFIGIIEKPCADSGRIRVLMNFLRQGTTVDVPVSAIGSM